MKTVPTLSLNALLFPFILGIIVLAIALAVSANKSLPLIQTPRAALIVLLVIGMTMCSFGIGQVAASGKWASPLAIAGYLLGTALLVVIFSGIFGWKLPVLPTPRDAVLAASLLIGIKYLIGTVSYFFHLL